MQDYYAELAKVDMLTSLPLAAIDSHRMFHFSIYQACGSTWLLRFLSALCDSSERYQLLSGAGDWVSAELRVLEHRRIMDACLAGEARAAAAYMESHLKTTIAALRPYSSGVDEVSRDVR